MDTTYTRSCLTCNTHQGKASIDDAPASCWDCSRYPTLPNWSPILPQQGHELPKTTTLGGLMRQKLGELEAQKKDKPIVLIRKKPGDAVEHPKHYTQHPSGVEAIQVTEHMNFCLGNAMKYIWRAGLKTENPVEDLRKAAWYINREIDRLSKGAQ